MVRLLLVCPHLGSLHSSGEHIFVWVASPSLTQLYKKQNLSRTLILKLGIAADGVGKGKTDSEVVPYYDSQLLGMDSTLIYELTAAAGPPRPAAAACPLRSGSQCAYTHQLTSLTGHF